MNPTLYRMKIWIVSSKQLDERWKRKMRRKLETKFGGAFLTYAGEEKDLENQGRGVVRFSTAWFFNMRSISQTILLNWLHLSLWFLNMHLGQICYRMRLQSSTRGDLICQKRVNGSSTEVSFSLPRIVIMTFTMHQCISQLYWSSWCLININEERNASSFKSHSVGRFFYAGKRDVGILYLSFPLFHNTFEQCKILTRHVSSNYDLTTFLN